MPWLVLLVSAVLEAVWATALGASDGLTRPLPVVVFVLGLVASMLGLGYAAKRIPIGTAYAVWTGTGAALTVTWAILTGGETATAARLLFLTGIVAAVVGLKLVDGSAPREPKLRGPRPPAEPDSSANRRAAAGPPSAATDR